MEVDERLRYLETRITSSLRPRNDDLKALFGSDQNRHAFLEFCNNEDVRRLFVYTIPPKSTLVASLTPPQGVRSKAVFFLKTNQASKLTKDNIRTDVVFTDCETTALMQLDLLVREVYLPLLCTDGLQTYSGVSADKLMDVMHRMTGNVEVTSGNLEGKIILPLPSIEVLAEAANLQSRRSAVIHVLESSVIGWIKQIKLLLRHDPLADLRHTYGRRPTPLDEVNMWKKRQQLLSSVNDQLDSPVASDILLNLDEASSTYSHSFHNVRKEIGQAFAETNENLRFLGTLLPWFEKLHQATHPEEMLRVFPPLIHTMLLVWSHSRYYHQKSKFHNLLELVSNEVVIRAQSLVGEDILHNTIQSYAGLKDALRVSAAYRGTYLDMKDTADDINTEKVSETAEAMNLNPPKGVLYTSKLYSTSTRRRASRSAGVLRATSADAGVMKEEEWTDSPWPPRNAPCFNLMNSFMERCNDLLELVQTTRHFNLLQMAAEVGGAGTKSLDALVREIHEEFSCAMEDFGKHVADILDITASQAFEKAFFIFRSIVKDLERRLAVVLRQSFQQCPTIASQLRLLEVFEGVSGREMVQEYLKDKDHQLINMFSDELINVRSMFLAKMKNSPLHRNLPPIVSRLTWVGALKRRIKEPMEKLKRISPHSLDGDAGWHLRDIFADTVKDFDKYEEKTVREWQNQLHAELRDRLKQPLLTAEEFDEEVDYRPQIISVNLDPDLLLLLREVHYLSHPPFSIKLPKNVRDLLRHTDATTLRMTAARLETIVSKYNSAMRSMVDFEKPLFERNMAKIDQLLDQGLNHYTWKTSQSADFIELASSLVGSELHRTLAIVQSNCQEMVDIAQSWSSGSLDVYASRAVNTSYHMDKLIEWQRSLNEEHERLVKPSGMKIHSLLQNSFEAVQISRASPAWEEYVDHMDALVLDGLKKSTLKSLRYMLNTLVHANVSEHQQTSVPILTVNMELIENAVAFTPPLDQSTAITSVLENVNTWLEEFIARGMLVRMLNLEVEGGYQDYISIDEEVQHLCEQIVQVVKENGEECKTLLSLFKNYTFLWQHNIQETFEEFLHGRLSSNPMRTLDKLGPSSRLRSAATERSQKSAQSGRASSASHYSISHAGAMGTAEKAFLTPKRNDDWDEDMNVPALDIFDTEIDVYRTARDEIAAIVNHNDVGWIRIDLQPIKQVLTTYASRWMWTFTKYLSDQVTELLTDLDYFLKRIEPEIESITGEERDTASFMKMMRIFNEVSAKQQEMDGQFTAMNRTVILLKKYAQALPNHTQALYEAAPGRWNNLKTKVSLAKQRLGPRIQEESASITKDLAEFGERVEALQRALTASEIYQKDCPLEKAFREIRKYSQMLEKLDSEAQDLIELQELLETAVVNFTILPESRHELSNLKLVWETVQAIQKQQNEWKQESWQKMETKQLREITTEQLRTVHALPEETHYWDVYMGLQESIMVIQALLPLIEDLSNPAMRTRHWKQLVRVTGGAFQTDNESLKRMTLGHLLMLGLQNHVEDVRTIVQRAVKDLTIENALKTYEAIWLSKLFELRPHVRTIQTGGSERADKEDMESKSEISQSDAGTVKTGMQGGGRTRSRMSNFTMGTAGRTKRASVSSLPASLLNLGEESGVLFLLDDTEPIFTELESHQVALQSMQSSSAAGSFLDEVTKWQKRLMTIEAVLSIWLEVQEKWVELEEVFSGADVKTSLSHEAALFTSANRDFRLLMRASEKNPNVLQCCQRKGILTLLEKMNNNLEICRKSLLEHLERRRQRFPRFYFLSMEDVLHIVCNGYDLNQVNLYLPKLFENLGQLEYEENPTEASEHEFQITGLISNMGERLPLKQPVLCDGPIENWLCNLLPAIKASLQQQLCSALNQDGTIEVNSRKPEREIHSAGARRVTLNKDEKNGKPATPRTGSRQGSRAGSRTGLRPNQPGTGSEGSKAQQGSGGSWMLEHVTEVVYLATQIQITEQMENCMKSVADGNKDAIQETLDKVTHSINAAVVMLKGIDDESERRARILKELRKKEKQSMQEANIKAGGSSRDTPLHSARPGSQSFKAGSQWSLNDPQNPNLQVGGQAPIAEEGSVISAAQEDMTVTASSEQAGGNGEGKPHNHVDTMKVALPPATRKVKVKVEEEIDKTDLHLMLFPGQIQKISNLIALMANQRDLITRLIEQHSKNSKALTESFDWRTHLKYIWDGNNAQLTVKLLDTEFDYGFEYLGSVNRLVLTPATERVFVSLTQAIKSSMAGLCIGPNWSARLEMISELSKVLGQPLYLFNCSSTMDSNMLGDIFRGLSSTGCWVCFNNLNHIQPSVLSICTQLLQSYLDSLRANRQTITFSQGEELALNPNGACLATLDSQIDLPHMPKADKLLILNSAMGLLPMDLSRQFRTVAVVNLDFRIAVEVMLLSQGFVKAVELSHQLVSLRTMCTNMIPMALSVSYNMKLGGDNDEGSHGWSLQNVRRIIHEAGAVLDELIAYHLAEENEALMQSTSLLLNNNTTDSFDSTQDPPNDKGSIEVPDSLIQYECEALVIALRNSFMPRLHGSDAEMFVAMVGDAFPDVGVPMGFGGTKSGLLALNTPVVNTHPAGNTQTFIPNGSGEHQPIDDIQSAIAVATSELGLLPGVAFQARVSQLAQLTDTHQTVVVVGPAGCGKSETIRTLVASQRELGKVVTAQRVFTEAVETHELLGYEHPDTREWKDGLFTALLRKHCLVPVADFLTARPHMKVLHLDGKVDCVQMEVLGSLFHNDGSLVLANNERIHIPDNVRFYWEMESVANLSPSVLSRVGVISLDKNDVNWRIILARWLDGLAESQQEIFRTLTDKYVAPTLEYLDACTRPALMIGSDRVSKPRMKRMIDVSEINMVTTFCHLLEALTSQHTDLRREQYERYVNFSCMWAFAGTLEERYRSAFGYWWRSTWEETMDFPAEGEVFDYFVDGETHEFVHWGDAIPPYSMPPHEGIPPDAFVHTCTIEQLSYLLGLLSDAGKHVLLAGEAGCGKTSIVNDRIRTVCSGEVAEVLALTISTNRFTKSRVLWQRLEERLEWKHGRTYIPKGSKKLMCLVDDLNIAHVDQFGRQSACEMVRQHLDSGGVYEPDTHRLREVKNVTYVTTLNVHTPASVPQPSQRLIRHFSVFGVPYPKWSEIHTIFTTLLNTHFLTPATTSSGSGKDKKRQIIDKEEDSLRSLMSTMVNVTIEVQDRMRTMFLPTAVRCHYIFTLRNVRLLFRNVCLSLKPGVRQERLLLLWRHECEWMYGHALVSPVDFDRFQQAFVTAVRKEFTNEDLLQLAISPEQPLFSNLVEQDSGIVTAGGYRTAPTGSTTTGNEDDITDQYDSCDNVKSVRALLHDAVEEYNKGHPKIRISLYRETIQRVCRLARTIMAPHDVGHSLLVADGNPGLSDLFARLAANLCGFNVFEVNPSPITSTITYKLEQFKADMVSAYTRAGVRGEKILLLLQEEELLNEDFLVYVSEFVVNGAITHLFSVEEQTSIINSIRTEVTAAGLTYTRETAWDFFLKTVSSNFRVVLVSSTTDQAFQRRIREYPALNQHLNIMWFQHWTRERLVDHAMFHLKGEESLMPIQKENLAHLLATMHLSNRQLDGGEKGAGQYQHLTNTTYEKFVERFLSMYRHRHQAIQQEHVTVTKALTHINRENKLAAKLQKQLEHEIIVLEERKEGTIKLLCQIGQDRAIAEQHVKIVSKQMEKIQALQKALPQYTLAHERAVYKAVSIVADTKTIVKELDIASLGEMRGMQKPDVDIEDLMAAIIMILKNPSSDLTWSKGAKRQMANIERFMEEMGSFDDTELPETTLNLVEPYLKKASFQPQNLLRKTNSQAAASLCKWVRGVVRYHRLMISKVKPLHQKVLETTSSVEEAEHKLATLENKKKALEARLDDLSESFESATVDKNDQDDLSLKMSKQLATANKFKEILATEYQHCIQICRSLPQRESAISGSIALAVGFATYMGPYNPKFRRAMLTIHWPLCLQERGVPLAIDSIDPIRGWIVEWSIQTARRDESTIPMRSVQGNAGMLQDEEEEEERHIQPVTREQLEQQQQGLVTVEVQEPKEDEVSGPQNDEGEEDDKEEEEEEKKGGEEQEGGGGGDEEMQQQGDDTLAPPENEQQQQSAVNASNNNYATISDAAESRYAFSMDEFPNISNTEYCRYIQSLIKLLVGDKVIQDWVTRGLSNRLMENLAIQKSSWQRPPVLIDPDMEGVRWMRKILHNDKLTNIDMFTRWRHQQIHVYSKETFEFHLENKLGFDPSIVVRIEKAILSGLPLLLMNCEQSLDSMVMPLIHHANHGTEHKGMEDARLIKYCGRRLLGHENFHVTLATNLPSPRFSPRIASTTMVINYNASPETMREELLDRAFARICPQLHAERSKVLAALQQHRNSVQALEEQLLKTLEGDIGSSDITAHTEYVSAIVENRDQVYAKLVAAEKILESLDKICEELLPVAKRGAMLYSVISSLRGIQREYQFSLPFFLWMFDQAVGEEPTEAESEEVPHGSEYAESDSHGGGRRSVTTAQSHDKLDEIGPSLAERIMGYEDHKSSPSSPYRGGGASSGSKSQQSKDEPLLQRIMSDISLPESPELPTPGVAYNSLSANQVKQLVDCLTQTVFQNIRQCVYEEHRLLFATMLCLNIQYETSGHFTEEELALLLQGNPGLGNMELSLADFDCDAPIPSFIPEDKWDDILAMSVLPGPLDGLCVQIAESPESWQRWYKSDTPENEPLPLRPNTTADGERPIDDTGHTSTQSSPDLGNLTDFHQLILLRIIRPDRLPLAMSRYVNRHLTSVKPIVSSIGSMMGSAERLLGVMVLLPPTPACGNKELMSNFSMKLKPTQVLQAVAQQKSITFDAISMGEGVETRLTMAIDAAVDNDGWLAIENLHLASESMLSALRHQLVRVGNTGGPLGMTPMSKSNQSRFCVWLTTEPSPKLPDTLLQSMRVVAWDNITDHLLNAEDTTSSSSGSGQPVTSHSLLDNVLKSAIASALNSISKDTWNKVQEQNMATKDIVFSACVIHGLLIARQMFGCRGLTQSYAFSEVQPNHAVQVILRSKGEGQEDKLSVEDISKVLIEIVYGNIITNVWDRVYLTSIVDYILTSATRQSGKIRLGDTMLATPPANVDPSEYPNWLEEKWDNANSAVNVLSLDKEVERFTNKASGNDFLNHLDNLYELQHSGPLSSVVEQKTALNLTKVQTAMDTVLEQLPTMLDLGELPLHIVNETEKYTFPYHAPSLLSLLSVAGNEMPQSIGFVLLQECHWLNSVLCHIRQSLHELEETLLGGENAIDPLLQETAKALQHDAVPKSWLHPHQQPTGHTLMSWTQGVIKCHDQMQRWMKEGKVPSSSQDTNRPPPPRGHLLSVWMGGLANPKAISTALKQEKAALDDCLMSNVDIVCDVSTSMTSDTFDIVHEGGMYLRDVWLEGASWDVDHGCIDSPGCSLTAMPSIYIHPVARGNETPDQSQPDDGASQDRESTTDDRRESTADGNADGDRQPPKRTEFVEMPVFMNRSRQICVFTLKLKCPEPAEKWSMAGVALILDPGAPEDFKKTVKFAKRDDMAGKDDTTSERTISTVPPSKMGTPMMQQYDNGSGARDLENAPHMLSRASKHSARSVRSLRSRQSVRSAQVPSSAAANQQILEEEEGGNEVERMEEEETEAVMSGEEEEDEDLELMMTARSENLQRQRHLTSTFDYRELTGTGTETFNTNQNAQDDETTEENVSSRASSHISQSSEANQKASSHRAESSHSDASKHEEVDIDKNASRPGSGARPESVASKPSQDDNQSQLVMPNYDNSVSEDGKQTPPNDQDDDRKSVVSHQSAKSEASHKSSKDDKESLVEEDASAMKKEGEDEKKKEEDEEAKKKEAAKKRQEDFHQQASRMRFKRSHATIVTAEKKEPSNRADSARSTTSKTSQRQSSATSQKGDPYKTSEAKNVSASRISLQDGNNVKVSASRESVKSKTSVQGSKASYKSAQSAYGTSTKPKVSSSQRSINKSQASLRSTTNSKKGERTGSAESRKSTTPSTSPANQQEGDRVSRASTRSGSAKSVSKSPTVDDVKETSEENEGKAESSSRPPSSKSQDPADAVTNGDDSTEDQAAVNGDNAVDNNNGETGSVHSKEQPLY